MKFCTLLWKKQQSYQKCIANCDAIPGKLFPDDYMYYCRPKPYMYISEEIHFALDAIFVLLITGMLLAVVMTGVTVEPYLGPVSQRFAINCTFS